MSHTKSDLLRLAQFSCTSCGGHCAISKSRAKLWTTVMLSWTTKNLCVFFPHLDSTLNLWVRPRLPMSFQCVSRKVPFFVEDARLSVLKLFHALRWSKPRCWSKNTSGFYRWLDAATRLGYQMELWQVPILGFFCEKAMFFLGGRGVNVPEHQAFVSVRSPGDVRGMTRWGNTAGFSAPPSNINKNTLRLSTLRKGGGKDG